MPRRYLSLVRVKREATIAVRTAKAARCELEKGHDLQAD